MSETKVVYTKAFITTFENLVTDKTLAKIEETIQTFEDRMSLFANSSAIVPELAELGINNYRQFLKNDYRIIYKSTDKKVEAMLLLHQRQCITSALQKYMILTY